MPEAEGRLLSEVSLIQRLFVYTCKLSFIPLRQRFMNGACKKPLLINTCMPLLQVRIPIYVAIIAPIFPFCSFFYKLEPVTV